MAQVEERVRVVSAGAITIEAKHAKLEAMLRSFGSVCIGYSGGVDSAFLAVAALRALGPGRVLAVTGLSPAYPAVQREQALSCARRFGVPHLELETDELNDARYAANPSNRCYYCKAELWARLSAVAAERGLAVVCDGANADDVADHRPGALAATERRVRSPLLESGLAKAEIRELSRRLGLPTWDTPASPCLASRLPYGVPVTVARLRAVEAAENALRALGLREFRVRHHGDAARVEVAPAELAAALSAAPRLRAAGLDAGFERVLIDVEGYRRGALNVASPLVRIGTATPASAPADGAPPLATAAALLREAGIDASVGVAGAHRDILVVSAAAADASRIAVLAAELKGAGFRYIALDAPSTSAAQ